MGKTLRTCNIEGCDEKAIWLDKENDIAYCEKHRTWYDYEIHWHNYIVADSLQEALEQVEEIHKELKLLAQWEKEGKIKGELIESSPSMQRIVVEDIKEITDGVGKQMRKMKVVSAREWEEDEYEDLAEWQRI